MEHKDFCLGVYNKDVFNKCVNKVITIQTNNTFTVIHLDKIKFITHTNGGTKLLIYDFNRNNILDMNGTKEKILQLYNDLINIIETGAPKTD